MLTAGHLVPGLWALLAPHGFYEGVPTVDRYPPFNEHLFRDYGGATLALALVLGSAAVLLERRLVCTALAADLLFALPHALFHLSDHGRGMPGGWLAAMSVAVVVAAALPCGLLLVARLPGRAVETSGTGGGRARRARRHAFSGRPRAYRGPRA